MGQRPYSFLGDAGASAAASLNSRPRPVIEGAPGSPHAALLLSLHRKALPLAAELLSGVRAATVRERFVAFRSLTVAARTSRLWHSMLHTPAPRYTIGNQVQPRTGCNPSGRVPWEW